MQNLCVIEGRVALDVESKVTNQGKTYVKNRLACRRDYSSGQDDQGRKQYETDWINIVCWGKTAEYLASRIKKGDLIEVVGRWQSNEFTDKDGQKRVNNELNFDQFYIHEIKDGGQPQQANFSQPNGNGQSQPNGGFQQQSFGSQQPFGQQQQPNNGFQQQPNNGFQQQSGSFQQQPNNFQQQAPIQQSGFSGGFNNPNNFGNGNNGGGFSQPTSFQR